MSEMSIFEIGMGAITDNNDEAAYEIFLEGALGDDPEACMGLGIMYLYGYYPKKDYEKAFQYFKTAFELSEDDSIGYISVQYITNAMEEIAENEKGKKYYIEYMDFLLENELWPLYITVAYQYGSGDIYPKDNRKMLEYLQIAADHDIEHAYECLGEAYFLGEIVERDYEKAYEYFMKANENCSNMKTYYLGEMYRQGIIFEKDIEKAKELYRSITEDELADEFEDEYYCKALERLGEI